VYTYKRKVTYSEIGTDQKVNPAQIVKYFQDCSTFNSEQIGAGLKHLEAHKHIWVLTSWQVIINSYPGLGEAIVTGTWAYDFNAVYGFRNFVLELSDGERAAYANSIWVLMDSESGKPVKLTEEAISGYEVDERIDMVYEPRRIKLPGTWIEKETLVVRKSDLDTNHHVNNARYIEMALEYVPDDFIIRQVRADYKKSAVYKDIILPKIHIEENMMTVALCDINGSTFVTVEFTQNK